MKFPQAHAAIIMNSFSMSLLLYPPASATSSQCIQCHTSKEKLQAIAKLAPEKQKSAEAEGTG